MFPHGSNVHMGGGGQPSALFNVCRYSVQGLKQPGSEVDHNPPSSAEVRRSVLLLPLYASSAWTGIYLLLITTGHHPTV